MDNLMHEDKVPIRALLGEGRPPEPLASAWVHDLKHSDKLAKSLGKKVKLDATVHKVESQHNPETGEKTSSVHFHVHGIHGIPGLGDATTAKSKSADLDEAMKSVNL